MEFALLVTGLVCAALGFVLGLRLGRSVAGGSSSERVTALATERDLLRERVTDLESEIGQEREVAATLGPLSASLQRVEAQVRTLERDRLTQAAALDAQLAALTQGGEALRVQTAALATALRSPTARGAWGELQLRRVVEHAGMLERVDFDVQVDTQRPDGGGIRPDMVVRLPGGKCVVVDAKAPLAAFLAASELQDDAGRQAEAAHAHARAVRAHVDALAQKRYWSAFESSPELVVCFLPGEAILGAACTADPTLLDHALGHGVVLATPATLLALLHAVALGWQGEALSGNARDLVTLGKELHERLSVMGGHISRTGRSLQRAVEDYNALVGTLERRVLVTARKLGSLGVGGADLPEPMPLTSATRPLTAAEFIDDAHASLIDDAQASLIDDARSA